MEGTRMAELSKNLLLSLLPGGSYWLLGLFLL
jgi:hypothetical protein